MLSILGLMKAQVLDKTFADSGRLTNQLYFSSQRVSVKISKIAIQSNSKIVCLGHIEIGSGQSAGLLFRLNMDGSVDNNFGYKLYMNDYYDYWEGKDLYIDSLNRIVLTLSIMDGVQIEQFASVIRLKPDGTPDETFNTTGQKSVLIVYRTKLSPKGLVENYKKGYYVGASYKTCYSCAEIFGILKFTKNGDLDTTFIDANNYNLGYDQINIDNFTNPKVNTILKLKNGNILYSVTGDDYSSNNVAKIIKLDKDAKIDLSYGKNGVLTIEENSVRNNKEWSILAMAEQQNGKVIAVGKMAYNYNSASSLFDYYSQIYRLNTNGTLDKSFKVDKIFEERAVIINDVMVQTDDKIIISGQKENNAFIARLNIDGTFDTSYSGGLIDIPKIDVINSTVIQKDGKYVFGGNYNSGFYRDLVIGRCNTTYAKIPSTNILSFNLKNNFILYPNPANSLVSIQSNEVFEKVEIFDTNGKKIIESLNSKRNNETIDISKLSKGFYIVKINNQISKLIIN